jgi:hypothetical protein
MVASMISLAFFADQAFRGVLAELGHRSEADIRKIPMIWSGVCDGVLTHATVFARNARAGPASHSRMAIGTAMSPALLPEDIGRPVAFMTPHETPVPFAMPLGGPGACFGLSSQSPQPRPWHSRNDRWPQRGIVARRGHLRLIAIALASAVITKHHEVLLSVGSSTRPAKKLHAIASASRSLAEQNTTNSRSSRHMENVRGGGRSIICSS